MFVSTELMQTLHWHIDVLSGFIIDGNYLSNIRLHCEDGKNRNKTQGLLDKRLKENHEQRTSDQW